ncbi:MAG: glutathione peroxidase [Phenylobacterium sp.]|uniref:glutathione peroxidase n=1 Tax=Phenylobacterium sp. TaxID=1871053 RepID=UPI0027341798|nr:glutathione peroxidase [Phenylobacterium sp.]MDP3174918.1 glutathione peroxidase [Phenylobacterium sp.]
MPDAYDYGFDAIAGGPLPLSSFKGKPMLVVNTASKCGLTPQYEGLEKLYRDYRDQGLVVLGVPCNQFAGQEPGTEAEIQDFCALTYDVDFPITAKVEVKGEGAHPFYKWAEAGLGEGAVPAWNFHKILVGKDGQLIRAFGSRTDPLDPDVVAAVKQAL